ncbi:MAG: HDOD domain-containing protein [Planctomycetota bacterium]
MFHRVFLPETNTPQIELPTELALRMGCNLDQLKVLPDVAVQALDIAKDPNCSVTRFSTVVEQDVKLTTDILRMANTVVFSGGQRITSLPQAIIRLGFRHCKNLILSSCIGSLMRRMSIQETNSREKLYKHGFLTALISANLNNLFGIRFMGEDFTAGLIHDLGRTLLAMFMPTEFKQFDKLDFVEDQYLLEREHAALGTTHCDVGGWFVQHNMLPDPLCQVVRFHHQPELSGEGRLLTTLVAASDEIANFVHQLGAPRELPIDKLTMLVKLEEVGVDRAIEKFADQSTQIVTMALSDLCSLNSRKS